MKYTEPQHEERRGHGREHEDDERNTKSTEQQRGRRRLADKCLQPTWLQTAVGTSLAEPEKPQLLIRANA